MKKSICLLVTLMLSVILSSCGAKFGKGGNGTIGLSLKTIESDKISETAQIIELNESPDYYDMEIKKNTTCVYFYSISYDEEGKLMDKNIISTMPVGMETNDSVVINATFPDSKMPMYAVGFVTDSGEIEYYTIKGKNDGKISLDYIQNQEDFQVQHNIEIQEFETEAVMENTESETEMP